jgi:hypothetical protein
VAWSGGKLRIRRCRHCSLIDAHSFSVGFMCGEYGGKNRIGPDDQRGTLALCGHDAAEHCRGSARGFRATAAAIVATTAASCRSRASFQNTRAQDLFSTHRGDEGLFPGLSSLMVEVLHRLSHGGSCHVAGSSYRRQPFHRPREILPWVPAATASTPR